MKPIVEALRTGTFRDSAGVEHTFTDSDLSNIASSYNPAKYEAPVVIGHPINNSPAYGWINRAFTEGQKLFLELKDLVPEFVELCKKGMYKKHSISLFPDRKIRHIGFLGAMPPVIKGLADVCFSEGYGCFSFDFSSGDMGGSLILETPGGLLQRLINAKLAKNAGMSFSDAFSAVSIENIDLAADYSNEIRFGR